MKKESRPYGLWDSPISPTMIGEKLRFSDVQWDSDGETLVWLESRSGRGVLVAQRGEDAPRDLTVEHPVRARVGYGGGDFTVGGGFAVFSSGGRLYKIPLEKGLPRPVTPAFGEAASPALSPDASKILFVHTYERKDTLAWVDSEGKEWPKKLVEGADFYMQPVWHPDGERIAWIEWNHPQMPWDGTRLKLARLEDDTLAEETLLAGDEETPIFQPAFSPNGRFLSYLAQDSEWDTLYLRDLNTGDTIPLVRGGSLMPPAWVQGMRVYAWISSREIAYLRNDSGFFSLWKVDVGTGKTEAIPTPDYTSLEQISASPRGTLAFIAASPQIPPRIVIRQNGTPRVLRRSMTESIPSAYLPSPSPLTWQAPDGTTVHGLYYPPASPRFEGTGLPPLIVDIHGGPTSQRIATWNVDTRYDAAFFTSRGYAVLHVNYRGSTGYGRSYMLALRKKWGLLDVEDAIGGAQALVDAGLADAKRLVIKGGSAGGYTVLNALARHPGFFKAGICLYGVSNLFTLDMETHKFEEHYTASMVGTLPEDADRYKEWSPIFHVENIRDALAVFQGAEDVVVPPNQAETIVAALRANGVPHIYRVYEGEGHGWRKRETIVSFYEDVERFLKEHVLFA